MKNGSSEERKALRNWFSYDTTEINQDEKIKAVKNLFDKTGASITSQDLVIKYTQSAFKKLDRLDISNNNKTLFKTFGTNLMERKF